MNIVFRVDASTQMGIGHLMRCLTLAEALRQRGVNTHFICREHQGHLVGLLRQKAMIVTVLPSKQTLLSESHNEDYSKWLGVTQFDDAEQTIAALDGEKPDWLIVDHYGLDAQWEKKLRPYTKKIMVIDDLANRQHICDVLLDQNYSENEELRYTKLVSNECKLYVGPRYALIRPEYLEHRKTLAIRKKEVQKVMVFFGGTDPYNMTGLTLEALSSQELNYLKVDVVVGTNNPHINKIEKQVANRLNTILHKPRAHLADLMAKADLAIGAGGVTTWERMCLGLPTIVISIAVNQQPASEALTDSQLIHYAGHHTEIKVEQLTQEIINLCHSSEKLKMLSTLNKLKVDGYGVSRIIEVLCPSANGEVRFRPACEEDVYHYFNWSSEAKISKNTNKLSLSNWSNYHSWYINKLYDLNIHMFVFEIFGLPLGQIMFRKENNDVVIEYDIDSILNDDDSVSYLIDKGIKFFNEVESVRLINNTKKNIKPNKTLFSRMGYLKIPDSSQSKTLYSISILSDQKSWMNNHIQKLQMEWLKMGHRVQWVHDKEALGSGDFCFYLSCGQIVSNKTLSQYRHNLVVHESDLPQGKGWSPLTWQILEGKNQIHITLLEAEEKVDSGVIYLQECMEFTGSELINELRDVQGVATLNLCRKFVDDYPNVLNKAIEQKGEDSFYSRRSESDSQLNPDRTIVEQFDLLRIVDNERYPAFFDIRNRRYLLKIERLEK